MYGHKFVCAVKAGSADNGLCAAGMVFEEGGAIVDFVRSQRTRGLVRYHVLVVRQL